MWRSIHVVGHPHLKHAHPLFDEITTYPIAPCDDALRYVELDCLGSIFEVRVFAIRYVVSFWHVHIKELNPKTN